MRMDHMKVKGKGIYTTAYPKRVVEIHHYLSAG